MIHISSKWVAPCQCTCDIFDRKSLALEADKNRVSFRVWSKSRVGNFWALSSQVLNFDLSTAKGLHAKPGPRVAWRHDRKKTQIDKNNNKVISYYDILWHMEWNAACKPASRNARRARRPMLDSKIEWELFLHLLWLVLHVHAESVPLFCADCTIRSWLLPDQIVLLVSGCDLRKEAMQSLAQCLRDNMIGWHTQTCCI